MKYFGQQMLFMPATMSTTSKLMEFVWDEETNELSAVPVEEAQRMRRESIEEKENKDKEKQNA